MLIRIRKLAIGLFDGLYHQGWKALIPAVLTGLLFPLARIFIEFGFHQGCQQLAACTYLLAHSTEATVVAVVVPALVLLAFILTLLAHLFAHPPAVTSVRVGGLKLTRYPLGSNPSKDYYQRPEFDQACHILHSLQQGQIRGRYGIIITGVPKVGKTRFALEMMRSKVSGIRSFTLVRWRDYYANYDFAPTGPFERFRGERLVLFLDNLPEYADPDRSRSVLAALARLQDICAAVLVIVTSREQRYEGGHGSLTPTGKQFGRLIDHLVEIKLDRLDTVEQGRFLAFLQAKRIKTSGVFDGLPGTILLGLDEVKTSIMSSRPPSKAILKAMALLRGAGVYVYPEALVRRAAERVFSLPTVDTKWVKARAHLERDGLVETRPLRDTGQFVLALPHDSYLEEGLGGLYPEPGRSVRQDFGVLLTALSADPPSDLFSDALFSLSDTLREDPTGDIGAQREMALQAAERALEPLDPKLSDAEAEQWARGEFLLGYAYAKRIFGDTVANLLRAHEAFTAALTIRTRSASPLKWAATMENKGVMLGTLADLARESDRPELRGNFEQWRAEALNNLHTAQTVYTRLEFPEEHRVLNEKIRFLEDLPS
jgi:hypothetical protein